MKTVYKTPYLDFKVATSPKGTPWHYVKRTNDTKEHDSAVVITTLVKKNNEYNFLFLKTSRPPITAEKKAKYCLESPAGLIGDENCTESLIECAKKELLEEAGYKADKLFIELKNCSTSAGLSSETLTYITAIINEDKIVNEPVDDGGIIVDRFFVPTDKLYSYLNSIDTKEISIAAATVCGIYYALNRLKILYL